MLTDFNTHQLCELRGAARQNVALLTRKGALRTVQDERDLRDQRSLMRRLTAIIKTRITQPPLF